MKLDRRRRIQSWRRAPHTHCVGAKGEFRTDQDSRFQFGFLLLCFLLVIINIAGFVTLVLLVILIVICLQLDLTAASTAAEARALAAGHVRGVPRSRGHPRVRAVRTPVPL